MRWNVSVPTTARLGQLVRLTLLQVCFIPASGMLSPPVYAYPNAKSGHRWLEPFDISIACDSCSQLARSTIRAGISSWQGIPGAVAPIGIVAEYRPLNPRHLGDGYNTITVYDLSNTRPNANALTFFIGTENSLCPCVWEETDTWLNTVPASGAWAYTHSAADSVPGPFDPFQYSTQLATRLAVERVFSPRLDMEGRTRVVRIPYGVLTLGLEAFLLGRSTRYLPSSCIEKCPDLVTQNIASQLRLTIWSLTDPGLR